MCENEIKIENICYLQDMCEIVWITKLRLSSFFVLISPAFISSFSDLRSHLVNLSSTIYEAYTAGKVQIKCVGHEKFAFLLL